MRQFLTLTVTKDFTNGFAEIIKKLQKGRVLVGIPEGDNSRDGTSAIGNAAILAINHFGSPANNIPPRPVLSIGIKNAQSEIVACFKEAARGALSDGAAAVTRAYNRAGSIAANSVKKTINAQEGFPGPSAATLAARKSKGFKGTKSLIVTGAMRNAITYVVKE